MKSRIVFIAALLSLSATGHAGEVTRSVLEVQGLDRLDLGQTPPCKPGGDGTYTEIVTTMASVLPPAEASAFLDRHCDECNRRRFARADGR